MNIMLKQVEAIFDGEVFRPEEVVELEANTRVRLIVEALMTDNPKGLSFLDIAAQLDLDGPADWSLKLDEYLYDLPGLDGR
jgi:hypothetical protein